MPEKDRRDYTALEEVIRKSINGDLTAIRKENEDQNKKLKMILDIMMGQPGKMGCVTKCNISFKAVLYGGSALLLGGAGGGTLLIKILPKIFGG